MFSLGKSLSTLPELSWFSFSGDLQLIFVYSGPMAGSELHCSREGDSQ